MKNNNSNYPIGITVGLIVSGTVLGLTTGGIAPVVLFSGGLIISTAEMVKILKK